MVCLPCHPTSFRCQQKVALRCTESSTPALLKKFLHRMHGRDPRVRPRMMHRRWTVCPHNQGSISVDAPPREKARAFSSGGIQMAPRCSWARSERVFGTAGTGITSLQRGVDTEGVRFLVSFGHASAGLTSVAKVRIRQLRYRVITICVTRGQIRGATA